MKRLVLLTLILSLATAPLAYADGPIVSSAKRAAVELAKAEPTATAPAAANASRAAVVQGDTGMSTATKLWIGIGFAAALAIGMKVIDNENEDRTPSTRRTRQDVGGCGAPWLGSC